MKYYVRELQIDNGTSRTAGIKARDDIEKVLLEKGANPIELSFNEIDRQKSNLFQKICWHFKIKKMWQKKLIGLKAQDSLYLQIPLIEHSIFLSEIIKQTAIKGVKIILFVHDLRTPRDCKRRDLSILKKLRLYFEEKAILQYCTYIVAHNASMAKYLIEFGVAEEKIINLEIFDYLMPDFDLSKMENKTYSADKPIIIAGDLRAHKAKYIYDLPNECSFNLFGIGYEAEERSNIKYFGSFPPNELPYKLIGSFGLVWDGISAKACEGTFGEYLKLNNPHKTSLYLASGIPVIIWKEAALSKYVQENNCGIVIHSLYDIKEIISRISSEEYLVMKENAERISVKLQKGFYTAKAIDLCEKNFVKNV